MSAESRAEKVVISELGVNINEEDAAKKLFAWQYCGAGALSLQVT